MAAGEQAGGLLRGAAEAHLVKQIRCNRQRCYIECFRSRKRIPFTGQDAVGSLAAGFAQERLPFGSVVSPGMLAGIFYGFGKIVHCLTAGDRVALVPPALSAVITYTKQTVIPERASGQEIEAPLHSVANQSGIPGAIGGGKQRLQHLQRVSGRIGLAAPAHHDVLAVPADIVHIESAGISLLQPSGGSETGFALDYIVKAGKAVGIVWLVTVKRRIKRPLESGTFAEDAV